jgi:hypothetical protein
MRTMNRDGRERLHKYAAEHPLAKLDILTTGGQMVTLPACEAEASERTTDSWAFADIPGTMVLAWSEAMPRFGGPR